MKLRFGKNLDRTFTSMPRPFVAGILMHASKLPNNDIEYIISGGHRNRRRSEGKYLKSFTLAEQL